jgi:hypothetical protein
MADETKKRKPVSIKVPSLVGDPTNDIRINKDAAERLVARYLREKLPPEEANTLASRIVGGMVSAMPTPERPALRGWRMISRYPPDHAGVAAQFHRISSNAEDFEIARAVWAIVFERAEPLPGDMVT